MAIKARSLFRYAVAAGVLLVLGPACALAQKGLKLSVGDDPSMKQGNPKLVFVEVSDFQCPYCARAAVLLDQTFRALPADSTGVVFKHFPLAMHPLFPIHPSSFSIHPSRQ